VSWLVETLLASTLLMAAVLALRAPVRRWFGPQVAYALWTLPAMRLLLPPIPAAWRHAAATPITRAGDTIIVMIVPADAPAAAASSATPWGAIVLAAWAAGAVLFLGWHALAHRRFCRRLLADATEIEVRAGVRVLASAAAVGPLAFGVRRPCVAFPRDFAARYDPLERELALDHELGHHARGDLVANWIALAVLAIHWCNPLAWRAFRAFRADQELANDARVLAGRALADRHVYACAIVKAAHGGAVSAACHLHTIEDLKGRLRMLTVSKTSRRRLATGAAAVGALGLVGLGLTVSGSQAAAAITDTVAERVGAAGQAVPPAPPAPPAPATAPLPPAPPAPIAGAGAVSTQRTLVRDGSKVQAFIARKGSDGTYKVSGVNGAPLPAGWAPQINIASGDCGPDKGTKTFVIRRGAGSGETTVICTDRIQAAAMAGQMTEADGQNIERQALTAALSGLRASRTSLAANAGMTAEARTEALTHIDEAIKEVEGDLASVGKDD